MARSYKSIFRPRNPKKYVGDSSNIVCRSNWERTFCNYCDTNDNNQAKWKYAREFCKDNSLEFKIITEDQLYGNRK